MLEYAMELEDAFEIEIEIKDIPPEATLSELADHLLSLEGELVNISQACGYPRP